MDIGSGVPLPYASLRPGVRIEVSSRGAITIYEPGHPTVEWPAHSAEAKDYRALVFPSLDFRATGLTIEQTDRVTRTVTYEGA